MVLRIFAALPVDARARCSAVCRDWCVLLLQPGAWLHLDLSQAASVDEALLSCASGRARGQLRSLKLDCVDNTLLPPDALLEVLTANRASLRHVSCRGMLSSLDVHRWLRAAPNLRSMYVSMEATAAELVHADLLRCVAPSGPLRLAGMSLIQPTQPAEVAAALRAHPGVRNIRISHVSFALRAVESAAVVDALLAGSAVVVLLLNECILDCSTAAALARLLKCSTTLQALYVRNACGWEPEQVLNADGWAALAAGVAANTTLRTLYLAVHLWCDGEAAAAVLQAAKGHPRVEVFSLHRTSMSSTTPRKLARTWQPSLRPTRLH